MYTFFQPNRHKTMCFAAIYKKVRKGCNLLLLNGQNKSFSTSQSTLFYQIFVLSMLTECPKTLDKNGRAAYNEHCSY